MKNVRTLIGIFAFSLVVLALPSAASAQWRDRDRNDDRYDQRYGYYTNIRQNIRNIENRSETFERLADRRNDRRDRYDSRRLEELAGDFRKAVRELGKRYGNGRNVNNSRDEARRVLGLATQIDREMNRTRNDRSQLAYEWREIGNDLDVIAAAYGFNNRRNNRRGGWGF